MNMKAVLVAAIVAGLMPAVALSAEHVGLKATVTGHDKEGSSDRSVRGPINRNPEGS
jgi:hypothetical protein